MNDHPLTDKMIDEIQIRFGGPCSEGYDDNMRAAADWQLEQVIRYLENDLKFVLWTDDFMDKFKKAMRPQQQEDNNE